MKNVKIAVVLEGGLIRGIFCDDPKVNISCIIIDYDIDGADKDELFSVIYKDCATGSKTGTAVGHIEDVVTPQGSNCLLVEECFKSINGDL